MDVEIRKKNKDVLYISDTTNSKLHNCESFNRNLSIP